MGVWFDRNVSITFQLNAAVVSITLVKRDSDVFFNFRFVLRRFPVDLIITFVDIEFWENLLSRIVDSSCQTCLAAFLLDIP